MPATNSKKDFCKLLNNSVFGKTMESVRKRVDIQLVRATEGSERERYRKMVAKPTFVGRKIFREELIARAPDTLVRAAQ